MVRAVITMLASIACGAAHGAVAHAQPTGNAGAGAGSIKGTVIFEGEAPERARLRRDTDPPCAKSEAFSEDVIVTNGKLKGVLVRIKNGALPAPKTVPPPAVIDQKDCTYAPHVVGIVVGQKLAVRNSDPAFHNVHGSIAGKTTWNKPSAAKDPDLVLDGSARAGDVIDVKCDVHPWMHAYAVVQDHTAFAVTDERGAFELAGLPPGSYTLEAWHPTLGTRTLDVKIASGGAKAAVTARISYKRSELQP
ncbi:MAG TPA: carboxypeptidase regulatory-like domain-containing protein [Kofleriaceae bacterium]